MYNQEQEAGNTPPQTSSSAAKNATPSKAVDAANARLIAAAPDLLEACEMVLLRLDMEAKEREIFPCAAMREDLRAAIAKANTPPEEDSWQSTENPEPII